MKTVLKLLLSLGLVSFLFSCSQTKPEKTIEGLKAAYTGESTASSKYAKFAQKAREEGYDTIAVMFEATSKAEAIHAENHKIVLEKLGVTLEAPVIGEFTVLTTAENLVDAIKGETYEFTTMYSGFLQSAETEKVADAKKSFTWAMDTEKKHNEFYQKALNAINAGSEKTLSVSWAVCPVCGNTFEAASVPAQCDFCMTPKEKFISFPSA
jgi:rubrerythrin